MPRSLDLDRDRLAVVQDRPMDLADRGGRERLPARTSAKTISGSAPSSCADDAADLVVAERRDLVEEPEQLVAVGDRQQVVAQRQHLAELDPGAAELARRRGASGPGRVAGPSPGRSQRRGDEEAEEDGQDVPDPTGVPEQRPHARSAAPASPVAAAVDRWSVGSSSSNGTRRRTARQGRLLLPLPSGPDELGEGPPRPP